MLCLNFFLHNLLFYVTFFAIILIDNRGLIEMRNKKGQALIEFVIILPVMLLLVFCLIDFGMVIYEKNNLENIVSDAANLYEDGKQIDDIKKIIGDNKNLDIK